MSTRTNFKMILLVMIIIIALFNVSSCNKSTDTPIIDNDESYVKGKSVFVHNLYGIAEYVYDDSGKLVEILTLDPITLSQSLVSGDKFDSKYIYDENGYISELFYFGRRFTVDSADANGRPLSASCNESDSDLLVKFSYNSNGNVASERFYENNALVMVNKFGDDAKPISLEYVGTGTLSFSYYKSEVNISMAYANNDEKAPDMTLYLNENGMPNYLMQSADGAVKGTTWTYDENMLCMDTLIESIYEGQNYREKYEIYRYEDGRISTIDYYIPNQKDEPLLYSTHSYEYPTDGIDLIQTDATYNGDDIIDKKVIYEYDNKLNVKQVTENYENGSLLDITSVEKLFDDKEREKEISTYKYDGNKQLTSKSVMAIIFGDKNELIERRTRNYSEDNELLNVFVETYEYGNNRKPSKIDYSAYDSLDTLIEKETVEYEYNSRGDVTVQIEKIFDKNGNLVNTTETANTYSPSGDLEDSKVTVYDKDGKEVKQ